MSDPWQRSKPISQPDGRVKLEAIGDGLQGTLSAVEEFNGLSQGWRLTFANATARQSGQVSKQDSVTLLATQVQLVGYLNREKPPLGTVLSIQLIGKEAGAAGFTSYRYDIHTVEGAAAPAAPPDAQPSLSDDLFG